MIEDYFYFKMNFANFNKINNKGLWHIFIYLSDIFFQGFPLLGVPFLNSSVTSIFSTFKLGS
jgi:hypothetical protein